MANYLHNYVSPLDITGTNPAYGTAAARVALRSDGSIVLSGRFHDTGGGTWSGIVTRLHADGTDDTGFGALLPTQFYQTPTSGATHSRPMLNHRNRCAISSRMSSDRPEPVTAVIASRRPSCSR